MNNLNYAVGWLGGVAIAILICSLLGEGNELICMVLGFAGAAVGTRIMTGKWFSTRIKKQ